MKKILINMKNTFLLVPYTIKLAWNFNKMFLVSRFFLAFLQGILPTVTVVFSKLIVEEMVNKNWRLTVSYIFISTAVSLVLYACINLINSTLGVYASLFRNDLFFKVLVKNTQLDLSNLDNPDIATKKELATSSAQGNYIINVFGSFFTIFSGCVTLSSVTYILSSVEIYIFVVLMVIILLRVLIIMANNSLGRKQFTDMAPINKEISYYMNIFCNSSYSLELKMHGLSEWIVQKYYKLLIRINRIVTKANKQMLGYNILGNVISSVQDIILYLFLGWRMIFAGLSFADFTMFFSALQTFSGTVSSLIGEFIGIGDKCKYVDAYRDYMNIENNIAVIHDDDLSLNKEEVTGDIVFRNVSFKYPGGDRYVLENINLELESGKFYVIVGVNGAGKSTFVNLLMRLYDVSSGEIMLNSNDIKKYNYQDYRNIFGTVFQDYQSFEFTIGENVALDDFSDSEECRLKINNCLCTVGLFEKINSLPKKIMTMLGKLFDENGTRLSGGELQKLALAKAIYRDPKIIILDEPTSALDAFAEDDLIRTFGDATRGKTVFYISHRLSVAKYADKVIFIDGNTVSGFDSHEQLLKNNRRYADMYEAQAKHYT